MSLPARVEEGGGDGVDAAAVAADASAGGLEMIEGAAGEKATTLRIFPRPTLLSFFKHFLIVSEEEANGTCSLGLGRGRYHDLPVPEPVMLPPSGRGSIDGRMGGWAALGTSGDAAVR
jgi:hypothetical protein